MLEQGREAMRQYAVKVSTPLLVAERRACADLCKRLSDCEESTDGYRQGAAWCEEAIRSRLTSSNALANAPASAGD